VPRLSRAPTARRNSPPSFSSPPPQSTNLLGDGPRRFDTFLCHNTDDKQAVRNIGRQLRKHGLTPWLDEWELRPGVPWQRSLEEQIPNIQSVVVLVGSAGVGPWQRVEVEAFLLEFVERGCPVIPVILPTALVAPHLPVFLKHMTWVDFRKNNPNPLRQLIWGITGSRWKKEC
jgi:hypothetical protein